MKAPKQFCHKATERNCHWEDTFLSQSHIEKLSRRHQSISTTAQDKQNSHEGNKAVLPLNKVKELTLLKGTKDTEIVIMKAPKQFCHKAIKRTRHREDTSSATTQYRHIVIKAPKQFCHKAPTQFCPHSNKQKTLSRHQSRSATEPYRESRSRRHQSSSATKQQREIVIVKTPKQFCQCSR